MIIHRFAVKIYEHAWIFIISIAFLRWRRTLLSRQELRLMGGAQNGMAAESEQLGTFSPRNLDELPNSCWQTSGKTG
jgi:hypothetical protein